MEGILGFLKELPTQSWGDSEAEDLVAKVSRNVHVNYT